MALDCNRTSIEEPSAARMRLAGAVMAAAGGLGMAAAAVAVLHPGLEVWVLTMAALALSMAPLRIRLQSPAVTRSLELPLRHPVLFASALVLGPTAAALPGVASGVAGCLIRNDRIPLRACVFAIFRPAGVCVGTSLVYLAAGGGHLAVQAVDSVGPVLTAAAAYMALSLLLAWAAEVRSPSTVESGRLRGGELLAAWLVVFTGGYGLAALYSAAPPYVLLASALAAAAVQIALRQPERKDTDEPAEAVETDDGDSFVDSSTGLANRRYLTMFLQSNLSRARRRGQSLSVAVLDLGLPAAIPPHSADTAARLAGAALREWLRDYDLVARYTDGRLLIVFPDTAAPRAQEVARRLLARLETLGGAGVPLRPAAGIAAFPEHAQTPEELINCSHHALNCGRATGRPVAICATLAEAS